MENNIKKNFVWNLIGLTLYSFVSLFLLIIVKRVNGIDVAGVFTYSFSLTTLCFYISLYFSRVYQISNYNDNKVFDQFFSFRLLSCFLSLLIVVFFCFINNFNFDKLFIIILLMLFRIVDALSDTFYGYLQSKGYLYKVGLSYSIKSIIGIILFILIDCFFNNLILAITILVVVNLILFLLYDFKNYRLISSNKKIKINFSNNNLILKEAFPIFVFSFLNVYLANSQKYVLDYFVENDVQTIFGILIMPATVLSLVGNYLIMPFINSLNEFFKKNEIFNFYKLSFKILFILLGCGLAGVIFCYFVGIPILNIIYDINLESYKVLFMIIIFASIMNALSMVISNMMTILNENKIQLFIYSFVAILGTILNILFIKNMFISGAVYSYLIIYCLMVILYVVAFLLLKRFRRKM